MLIPSHLGQMYHGSECFCLHFHRRATGVPETSPPEVALGGCDLEGLMPSEASWALAFLTLTASSQGCPGRQVLREGSVLGCQGASLMAKVMGSQWN